MSKNPFGKGAFSTKHTLVKITGAVELSSMLIDGANMDDVKNYVRQNGYELQIKAMYMAPFDTGFLQRSIDLLYLDDGFTAQIAPYADYAHIQEFGSRYQWGTPFMRPSLKAQMAIFKVDLQRVMIAKVGKK